MLASLLCAFGAGRPSLDLTGQWDFYADVGDAALESVTNKPGKIIVPGAWQRRATASPAAASRRPSSDRISLRRHTCGTTSRPAVFTCGKSWCRRGGKGVGVFLAVRRVYRYADVTVNGRRIGGYEGFRQPV